MNRLPQSPAPENAPRMLSTEAAFGVLTAAEELESPDLRRLYGEWNAAATATALPNVTFIDPLRLEYLLGSLVVFDVVGQRFRYRLIGTDLVDRRGLDQTGRWLDEHVDPVAAEVAQEACALCRDSRRPVRLTFQRLIDGNYYRVEDLLLPLAGLQGAVNRILVAQIYPPEAPRKRYGSR